MSEDAKSGIVRVVKRGGFTVLDNTACGDKRLSFKAVGIHTYLMTKPDNWQVYGSYLAETHKDGRDAVYAGLKELEECGYLVRRVLKDAGGKIIGRESVVYERPTEASQTEDPPYSGKPVLREIRVTEKPELISTDFPIRTDEQEVLSFSPLRDEHAAGEQPAASPAATAPQEAQRAAESVVPDIRTQSREQAPKSLRDLAADLRRRKPGGNPPPSALQAMAEQEVLAGTGGESQMVVPAAPQQEQQAPIPPLPAAPLSSKGAVKRTKPIKEPKHAAADLGPMKDAVRAALYPGIENVNWGPINTAAGGLLSSGLQSGDVAPLVAYMRGLYKFRDGSNPILPRLLRDYVDAWRSTRTKTPTSPVANFLQEKYGEEDLF